MYLEFMPLSGEGKNGRRTGYSQGMILFCVDHIVWRICCHVVKDESECKWVCTNVEVAIPETYSRLHSSKGLFVCQGLSLVPPPCSVGVYLALHLQNC